jgi:branched-chain amino acid transport system substrate-binding protein
MRRAGGDTPEAIRDALQATKGFPGATGSITLGHERNAAKNVLIVRITKGGFAYHTSIDMPETSGAPAAP